MKLIIDIPEEVYKARKTGEISPWVTVPILDAVQSGIPLDDVKAEIAEEICLTDNPYTKETKYTIEHSKLLELLNNIGKTEREKA